MIDAMPPRGPARAAYLRDKRNGRVRRKLGMVVLQAHMDMLNNKVASLQEGTKQEEAQKEQLRRQVKLNDLFERLITWRRTHASYATMDDMMTFYASARAEFGFTSDETRDIEKAVETVYWAEQQAGREALLSRLIPPQTEPAGFWQSIFGSWFS